MAVLLSFAGLLIAIPLLGLGRTAGYHRMLAHHAFKAHPVIRYTLVFFGSLYSGSPIRWCGIHRLHHSSSDQPNDPHSPTRGFWFAHSGCIYQVTSVPLSILIAISGFGYQLRLLQIDLMRLSGRRRQPWREKCPDLAKDRFFRFLDTPLVIPMLFATQLTAGWLIGGWWGIAWLWAFHVLQNNAAWIVNSICHSSFAGVAHPDSRDLSRDVAWLGWLTNGESFHNTHHRYPWSARHACQGGMDLSWSLICLLAVTGLASAVKIPEGIQAPGWVLRRNTILFVRRAGAAAESLSA